MRKMVNICVRTSDKVAQEFKLLSTRLGLTYGTLLKLSLDAYKLRGSHEKPKELSPPKVDPPKVAKPSDDEVSATISELAKQERFSPEE